MIADIMETTVSSAHGVRDATGGSDTICGLASSTDAAEGRSERIGPGGTDPCRKAPAGIDPGHAPSGGIYP
jgi:hypothetical protein